MTIEEIFDSEDISVRSLNICNDNGLKDLSTIIKYYVEHKTFINLKNCGRRSNLELIDICNKYYNQNQNGLKIEEYTEKENLDKKFQEYFTKLSNRSKNSLKYFLKGNIDLESFSKLIIFNSEFKITKLKNIGSKSIPEIKIFLKKIKILLENEYEDPFIKNLYSKSGVKHKNLENLINKNYSRTQREIINSFIDLNSNNLSNRSKNSITSFLKGNLKFRNISENILLNDEFNIEEIRNVGRKNLNELIAFFDSIIDFIEKVSEIENEKDLVALRNRFFIEKTFSISSIPNDILESRSIFILVDYLINKDALFEINDNIIFQKSLKIYNDQPEHTLDYIAEELNISRERVRQIRKNILDNLVKNFQFVKNIDDNLYQKYEIDQNQHLISLDDNLNNLINLVNNTNFSKTFNTFITYSFISNNFDLVGIPEDVLQPKFFNSRGRHNWGNFYLVNKNISSLLNFNDFTNDIYKRINERIEESYKLNFNSYLLNFSISINLESLNIISKVAEIILNNEFGIYLDIDDNIRFFRNSLMQSYEYAHEALEALGQPSKVNQILRKIEELHPDYITNNAKVRVSMKRQYGFVPIGRNSIFGLKKWENELNDFKGGTIRSIVSEYLESEDEPKHISDIAVYVLKYRPNTYMRSIMDNLKADEAKPFVFFINSTIGLRSKSYDNSFVELNHIELVKSKIWEERYNDLTKFIIKNNRLPHSRRCPDEIRLYRWHSVQVRKNLIGKLDNEKSKLLDQITIKFARNNSKIIRKSNNIEKYDELKLFVILNKRLPSADIIGEENIFRFLLKQRKMFEQGNLNELEENLFFEIAKIIQNQKYENKRN